MGLCVEKIFEFRVERTNMMGPVGNKMGTNTVVKFRNGRLKTMQFTHCKYLCYSLISQNDWVYRVNVNEPNCKGGYHI